MVFRVVKDKVNNTKFEVEMFNDKGKFSIWQRRVKTIVVKEGLYKAVTDKGKNLPGCQRSHEMTWIRKHNAQ